LWQVRVARGHQVEDRVVDADRGWHIEILLVFEPEIAQEARQQGTDTAGGRHRNRDQGFGARDVPAKDSVRDAKDQHAIRVAEGDFVIAGAVEEREIRRPEARFAAILAAGAFAFHLQMQEEEGRPGPGNVLARVAHELCVGVHFGQCQFADSGAQQAAAEGADVDRIG
jgi:hypothetical protein